MNWILDLNTNIQFPYKPSLWFTKQLSPSVGSTGRRGCPAVQLEWRSHAQTAQGSWLSCWVCRQQSVWHAGELTVASQSTLWLCEATDSSMTQTQQPLQQGGKAKSVLRPSIPPRPHSSTGVEWHPWRSSIIEQRQNVDISMGCRVIRSMSFSHFRLFPLQGFQLAHF